MANERTGNVGENNYIFKYNGDVIEFDQEYTTIGEVLVLDDDEDEDDKEDGSYVIECFEITSSRPSSWFLWGKDIILKNATQKKLKVKVQYPGVDYYMDPQRRY